MFGGQFSHTKFSLPSQLGSDISIRLAVYGNLLGRFGAGADAKVSSMALAAQLSAQVGGVSALPLNLPAAATLSAKVSGLQAIGLKAAPTMFLQNESSVAANIGIPAELEGSLSGQLAAGANIYSVFPTNEKVSCIALLAANLYSAPFYTALLGNVADAAVLDEQTVLITVAIPPGSELRIDSGTFTVTLDGENILHLQQGDWIALDRELAALVVDSGTAAQLSGNIIYTEKFL